jgi:hypothetical protein
MVDSVTYAGRTITLDSILDARQAIEDMAMMHKESTCSDVIHVGCTTTTVEAVRDVCMLASAMWYRIKTISDD